MTEDDTDTDDGTEREPGESGVGDAPDRDATEPEGAAERERETPADREREVSTDREREAADGKRQQTVRRAPRSLAGNRTVVAVAGGVIALLGVLAIAAPFVTGLSLSLVLGALLVAGGFLRIAAAFSAPAWGGAVFEVGLAILYGVAGVSLLVNPVLGLATLTLLLGAYFLAEGVVKMLMGLRVRRNDNWGWLLFSGAVSLVLASLILLEFPSSAAWAVGLLVGVDLVTSGLAVVLLGLGAEPDRAASTTGRVGDVRSEP
jgi:uncharacterized membrane protein HdeD (DUF308 family)